MDKKIFASVFDASQKCKTKPVWQYDYGRVLQIELKGLPEIYEVHFGLDPRGEATVVSGGADGVAIPDGLLEDGGNVFAWLFLHDGSDSGYTVYQVEIPVKRRGRPVGETPDASEQTVISGLIANMEAVLTKVEAAGDSVTSAKNAAELAQSKAEASETNAKLSQAKAEAAQAKAEIAQDSAETARTGAETAQSGAVAAKTAAEKAQKAAETAKTGATSAKTAAETAKTGAETAQAGAVAALETFEQKEAQLNDQIIQLQRDNGNLRRAVSEAQALIAAQDKRMDAIRDRDNGILRKDSTGSYTGSTLAIPVGAMRVAGIQKIGGMSRAGKNLYDSEATVVGQSSSSIEKTGNGFRIYTTKDIVYSASKQTAAIAKMTIGKTYTLSTDVAITSGVGKITLRNDANVIKKSTPNITQNGHYALTFVHTEDLAYFSFFATYDTAGQGDVTYSNIMLAESPTDVAYEPYTEELVDGAVDSLVSYGQTGQTLDSRTLPPEMLALCPDYGRGISNDLYNYIDFGGKQYHKKVGVYQFSGTEVVRKTDNDTMYVVTMRNLNDKIKINRPESSYNITAVLFPGYTAGSQNATKSEPGNVGISTWNTTVFLYFNIQKFEDETAVQAFLKNKKMLYELEIEEVVDLDAVWPEGLRTIAVEASGKINMHYPTLDRGYEIAVPSEITYMMDVEKMAGG